jgi:gliding motility-associated-like protein
MIQKKIKIQFQLIRVLLLLVGMVSYNSISQTLSDSLSGFDETHELNHIMSHDIDSSEIGHYLDLAKRRYIDRKYNLGLYAPPESLTSRAGAFDCTVDNWDFENGTLGGWNQQGAVQIVNNGVDPYGGFPWVYPGGGNFSAKISSDDNCCKNGRLDKVLNVPVNGETLLNFHFAMSIFNFPHTANQAAKLWVEFYDANGNLLPCPQYECYYSSDNGAVGVNNFQETPNNTTFYNPNAAGDGPQNYPVTYAEWNTVTLDLSGYQGQQITAVFRVEWCIFGPDWAYVLLDVDCPLNTFDPTNICLDATGQETLCGPDNMSSYTWFDPSGNVAGTNQCLVVNTPGNYVLETMPDNVECTSASLLTLDFQVEDNPEVNIPIIEGCRNESLTFTENAPNLSSPIVDWNWTIDDMIIYNTQTFTQSFSTDGYHTYELTVENDNGCITTVIDSIYVFPDPTADFQFVNDCFYDEITFTNNSSNEATGFEWDFNDGNVSTDEDPGHIFSTPGSHDVELIVTTDDGCKDAIIKTISAYPKPVSDFNVDPVCLLNSSVFEDESSVDVLFGDLISDYSWDFGNGSTSSDQNPSNEFSSEGNHEVTFIVTTNNGCKDTLTQTATVWPLPYVDFSPTDVCLEFDTEFIDESTISNTYTNNNLVGWVWDFGDGNGSNVKNPIHSYTSDGVYNTNLTVTSGNGCVNDTTLEVTVHPKPEASFTGINLDGCAPICPEVTSTSIVNTPSNIVNYEWRLSDGTIVDGPNSVFADCYDNETGNSIFYGLELEVTTNEGCKDVHTEANYIEVYHNPIANFYFAPNNPDVIDPVVSFTNTSSHADFYNWTFSGIGSSSDVNPIIEYPAEPGTYEIELIANTDEGCTDTSWIAVEILDRIIFYVPNTFTPDKDNFNEIFQPIFTHGYEPSDFNLLIFNRWGEVVFESNDASIGWDGTYGSESREIVKDGTYVWKLEFKETMSDKRHTHTGHVNVLK